MPDPVHVTFIHGLANKPAPRELERIWLEALTRDHGGNEGFDLATQTGTSSFVYWADLFYPKPLPPGEYENTADDLERSVAGEPELAEDAWVKAMRARFPDQFEDASTSEADSEFERIPLPWALKQRIMRHFLKEAHDYFFNTDGVRDKIRQRVVEDLDAVPAGTRHVLVGHSQGTFIAYDVLTAVAECKPVQGFMTIGSPLGVDEVQDKLVWSRDNGFPTKLEGDWVNVYDALDVVSRADPKLAGDFKKNGQEVVIDVMEQNWGKWRHSATKYLQGPMLRDHLRRLCDRAE